MLRCKQSQNSVSSLQNPGEDFLFLKNLNDFKLNNKEVL